MDGWLVWLIVAAMLAVAEIFTLTAALAVLGGAALATAGFAAIGLPAPVQLLVFTVAATAGMLLVRPIALRHRGQSERWRFGVDALIGQTAHVTQEVTGTDGRVRIGGEEWTARAYDRTLVIPAGASVDVLEISGSTALVYPRE
ncbi:NfeD family protein [Actinomadura kijaniata]|uniref:Membrane protein implicated in regulation of membrane protease activity n=1 Tax=Actinomadura namibiensis TaxID=182080 RepID=A0A7W3LR19_ACTNM|nr:NfeD family protein [Actinomadura namibiensis]MBA8952672.1 membrane protein implicated in regulation of membrane protease activity [Actinomadura namibiensis]